MLNIQLLDLSDNTIRSFKSSLKQFQKAGYELPCSPQSLVQYLVDRTTAGLSPATMTRHCTAIGNWHRRNKHPDPTKHEDVKQALRVLRKRYGRPAKKAKVLTEQDLTVIIKHLNKTKPKMGLRDKALILVGFFGAFRRSELVALKATNVALKATHAEILVEKSKTDQYHKGQKVIIPKLGGLLCPYTALKNLLEQEKEGFLFKSDAFRRNYPGKPINSSSFSEMLQRFALRAGLEYPFEYSGHSLRRGFATYAVEKGFSLPNLMKQGRWRSTSTVSGYYEVSDEAQIQEFKKISSKKA
jgi:integrase